MLNSVTSDDLTPPGCSIEGLNTDSWYGVQDARRRKQIQDRLAQRVRRKRVADSKRQHIKAQGNKSNQRMPVLLPRTETVGESQQSNAREPSIHEKDVVSEVRHEGTTHSKHPVTGTGNNATLLSHHGHLVIGNDKSMAVATSNVNSDLNFANELDIYHVTGAVTRQRRCPSIPILGHDHTYISSPNLSVYSAMYQNGCLLGIVCGHHRLWKSPEASAIIPISLRPTPLQASIVHKQWLDQFPFPRLRDNLILLNGLLDENTFLGELFSYDSLTVKSGASSWDPTAWSIVPAFKAKWGFLFAIM